MYNFCHEKAFKSTVKIYLCEKRESTFQFLINSSNSVVKNHLAIYVSIYFYFFYFIFFFFFFQYLLLDSQFCFIDLYCLFLCQYHTVLILWFHNSIFFFFIYLYLFQLLSVWLEHYISTHKTCSELFFKWLCNMPR